MPTILFGFVKLKVYICIWDSPLNFNVRLCKEWISKRSIVGSGKSICKKEMLKRRWRFFFREEFPFFFEVDINCPNLKLEEKGALEVCFHCTRLLLIPLIISVKNIFLIKILRFLQDIFIFTCIYYVDYISLYHYQSKTLVWEHRE